MTAKQKKIMLQLQQIKSEQQVLKETLSSFAAGSKGAAKVREALVALDDDYAKVKATLSQEDDPSLITDYNFRPAVRRITA